ncbi:hypothetical protein NDU88_004158 [Pleurodeles waltl]|uniref:Uncharacterized protein n=1 Tax=Pleurodeles waltl TaxID=8319 RepID=A0AAV7RIK2_PLEWA|nr:hypothetical protein NDU88_004158 [Pleurodeles waltl]
MVDIKFSLFEPARMWIMKDGRPRGFLDRDALRHFLEDLTDYTMGHAPLDSQLDSSPKPSSPPLHPEATGTPTGAIMGQKNGMTTPLSR